MRDRMIGHLLFGDWWIQMKGRLDGHPMNGRVWDLNRTFKGLNFCFNPFHFFFYKMTKEPSSSSPANPVLSFVLICLQMFWWMGSHVTVMSLLTAKWVTLWAWRYIWPIGARTQWAPWLWLWFPIRTSRTESRTIIWRTRSPSSAPTPSTLTRSVFQKQTAENYMSHYVHASGCCKIRLNSILFT